MADQLAAPPALSTSAEHLFEHVDDAAPKDTGQEERATTEDLLAVYEVERTARDIYNGRRRRVALQFPDHMLRDAPAVVALLKDALAALRSNATFSAVTALSQEEVGSTTPTPAAGGAPAVQQTATREEERIYILADTSYSACCVDEVAAEHVDADVVVHYGRSCLSPTSRLPVIHVFTKHRLDHAAVLEAFEKEFPDKESRAVLVADVTYHDHLPSIFSRLKERGYVNVLSTSPIHNPTGKLPNRTVLDADGTALDCEGSSGVDLGQYHVFHISSPPTSLLLALLTRVESLRIFPTPAPADSSSSHLSDASSVAQFTRRLLGRRYAKLLTLSTAGIIGILVNTLSVSNYMSSLDAIRKQIAAAGKKSYTVVVGKLNPAKLANFAEIDGWVVVGCWESSLVEDDASFYRAAITPFELEVALMKDDERIWGERWWGGIEGVKEPEVREAAVERSRNDESAEADHNDGDDDDDDESAPPEFDLRTGKLVSRSRPMRASQKGGQQTEAGAGDKPDGTGSSALALRPKAEVATINGVVSPGAEFLRSQRTWTGLGSDFDTEERSAAVEEGRSGVARGYTVGSIDERS
ncbi:hypothetical protein RB595_002518 [Gaeumannomyces hyphopodioides]